MNVSDAWHVLAIVKQKVNSNRVSTTRLSGSFNTPMKNRREKERKKEREREREKERRLERVNRSICLGFAAITPKQVRSFNNHLEGSGRGIAMKTGACILSPMQLTGPYSCHGRRFSENK